MSMKYDFTTILDREGTGAIAVSKIPFDNAEIKEGFSKIPMWVADMNYATAPSVIAAIQNRLAHPVFGYFDIKDAYSESIIEWQKTRNGVTDIPKEAIDYENGVLGGVSSVLQAFTAPGEAILLHSPAYIGFIGTITNMGRRTSRVYGAWIMRIWIRSLRKIIFIWQSFALLTTRVAVYGSVKRLRRQWKFMKRISVLSFQMRSGLI